MKTHLCYYFKQTEQITVHIHMNQQWRLLSLGPNGFHTCSVLSGWEKIRWIVYFVFLAQTICKTKLKVSAFHLGKWWKTNTIIQINNIWVWDLCKTDILKNVSNKWLLLLRGLQPGSSTLLGSGRWILWIHRKEKAWAYTCRQQWYHLMLWIFTLFTKWFAFWDLLAVFLLSFSP